MVVFYIFLTSRLANVFVIDRMEMSIAGHVTKWKCWVKFNYAKHAYFAEKEFRLWY